MQSASNYNIDQYYYYKNRPVHASLDKATKNSKIEKPKLKIKEPKALNNSLCPN